MDDCHLLSRAFEAAGLAQPLVFVRDGRELLEHLEGCVRSGSLPGLILMDLNMPRLDGSTALRRLRQDPRLQAIPVLILTTSNAPADVLGSYRLGANSVFVKPFGYEEFVALAALIKAYWLGPVELPCRYPLEPPEPAGDGGPGPR